MLETVNGIERETKRASIGGTFGTKIITKRDAALVQAQFLTLGDVIADGIVESVHVNGNSVWVSLIDASVHAKVDQWVEVAANVAELFRK